MRIFITAIIVVPQLLYQRATTLIENVISHVQIKIAARFNANTLAATISN